MNLYVSTSARKLFVSRPSLILLMCDAILRVARREQRNNGRFRSVPVAFGNKMVIVKEEELLSCRASVEHCDLQYLVSPCGGQVFRALSTVDTQRNSWRCPTKHTPPFRS